MVEMVVRLKAMVWPCHVSAKWASESSLNRQLSITILANMWPSQHGDDDDDDHHHHHDNEPC